MEVMEDLITEGSKLSPPVELKDEDECGLYFTSGTTGAPKPILLLHKNAFCPAVNELFLRYCMYQLLNRFNTGGKVLQHFSIQWNKIDVPFCRRRILILLWSGNLFHVVTLWKAGNLVILSSVIAQLPIHR